MSTHTPGEWMPGVSLFKGVDHFTVVSKSDTRKIIAITGRVGALDAEEGMANAIMVSASPALLKALKSILDVVSVRIDDPRIGHFDQAHAAIKQAEGDES